MTAEAKHPIDTVLKPAPAWRADAPRESLEALRLWAIEEAVAKIRWYYRNTKWKRRGSKWLRTFSIILTAVAALCPLLDNVAPRFWGDVELSPWSFVLLALAASFVGYDRFFGLSTAWMRFTTTGQMLERLVREFEVDWALLEAGGSAAPVAFLQRLRRFVLAVCKTVQDETLQWATEFQGQLAEMERRMKAAEEAPASPGTPAPDTDEPTTPVEAAKPAPARAAKRKAAANGRGR